MKKIILGITLVVLGCELAFCNENFNYKSDNNYNSLYQSNYSKAQASSLIKNGIITVPAGEVFKCVFMSPVSSESAYTGQEITLALANDFYYNNNLIAPSGSKVTGTVIEVAKAKHGSLSGKLTLRFTHIYTPTGLDIPISALIKTTDGSGALLGGRDIGLVTSEIPASSESVGHKGFVPPYMGVKAGTAAAMTTAVETGGGGLLKSIWDKGNDVEISVNSRVDLILTQPITIMPQG